jgi:hypothetical protein
MISPAPSIHVAVVEDDLVALDLETDAYFCLPDLGRYLSCEGGGRWTAASPAIAQGLVKTGLFQTASSDHPVVRPTPAVRTSRFYEGPEIGVFSNMALARVMAFEAWRIPGRPLRALIARSPCLPLRYDRADDAMAEARLFDRWMPWAPGQGQCLYRACLLRAHLASRGLGSTWIFGVRTWPFSAHCWLQVGDVLLDDDLDRVALYTPILVIGA